MSVPSIPRNLQFPWPYMYFRDGGRNGPSTSELLAEANQREVGRHGGRVQQSLNTRAWVLQVQNGT
jgi:hypothetical protein